MRDRVLACVSVRGRSVVAGYWPVGSELDDRPILEALQDRCQTALPVVAAANAPLQFRAWRPGEPLVTGYQSIPTPLPDAPTVTPDLLIVPLVGFDREGYRLGQGGGFYDRTITLLRQSTDVVAVGVGFAVQELVAVPRESHDQPLDWIVTERFLLKTR